ncbi:MAG TPA: hypothetical protein V6C97_19850 [Oculatellaceae cyanobacterium]
MSKNIVDQDRLEINGDTSTKDQAMVLVTKLKALLELGMLGDVGNYSNLNLHSYLCVLSDLVDELEVLLALA